MRLSLGHDVSRKVNQTDNATALSMQQSCDLTETSSSSSARHAAVGVHQEEDVFGFGFNEGDKEGVADCKSVLLASGCCGS